MTRARLLERMLEVLESDILPLTRRGIDEGNKIFGAAILVKATLELVVAGTNEEIRNPLWHGEISCLNRYWALPGEERPKPADCFFLSTHEPCSLCLSAITWSGFDNFYYLFSYEDSRDEFAIPHDLKILEEVFRCPGGSYAPRNAYWTSYHLPALIEEGTEEQRRVWLERVGELRRAYGAMSEAYQADKNAGDIPLP